MAGDLIITRNFDAPREHVWEMWTRPEHFSIWFGTDQLDVPLETVAMDVRVGGSWQAVMVIPDGRTIDWSGEYVEVDAPSRLAMMMNDDPSRPAGVPVTIDLVAVEGGTEMTLVQARGDFSDEQVKRTVAGYDEFFDVVERLLAERV